MFDDPYRAIVESADDPIFIADVDARYVFVNERAAQMLGFTVEQLRGKTVHEIFPPAVAVAFQNGVREVIGLGKTLKSEDRLEIAGVEVWNSTVLQPLRDRDGRVIAAQGIVRDITRQKHAEFTLRSSEERLRQAIRVAQIGIWDYDAQNTAMYFSPRQREIWGFTPDEPVSWGDHHDMIHPEDRARFDEAVSALRHSADGAFDLEHRIVRRDGSVRWLAIRGQAFYATDGSERRVVRAIGATRDITADKDASDERVKLQEQLLQAQKLESIGRLAGGIAHDFNNMLSVIVGCAELASEASDPLAVREYLDDILLAAKRSTDITRQLLGFARRQMASPRVLDLNAHVSSSLKMLQRLIGEHITLTWRPGGDVWPVHIDPAQLDQILVNLTANARDAISDVGDVTIATSNISNPSNKVSRIPDGSYVRLDIVDNGKGMDLETQRHLFEPFYTTKEIGSGTGLGLASVEGIARQNGGQVMVETAPGCGTTVSVFLPRVNAEQLLDVPPAREVPTLRRETILVVEDEAALLRLTTRILERLGYTVLGASSPDEALTIANTYSGDIHLVITDVVMPQMNGRMLAAQLLQRAPRLKCLLMSGYPDKAFGNGGILDDGVNFLPKPFSSEVLAAKVRQLLEG